MYPLFRPFNVLIFLSPIYQCYTVKCPDQPVLRHTKFTSVNEFLSGLCCSSELGGNLIRNKQDPMVVTNISPPPTSHPHPQTHPTHTQYPHTQHSPVLKKPGLSIKRLHNEGHKKKFK